MSIHVSTSTVDGSTGQNSVGSTGGLPSRGATSQNLSDRTVGDTVTLSNANTLVSLAKGLNSADRQAKLTTLASQVRSGQYQSNVNEVSRAIVQDLIRG